MTAATLFSGIGAPETAMPSWRWLWHAEIEKFPAAVCAARHPQSVNLGDVTADDFIDRALAIGRPDVLVFGSPCQSFSVAGKRLGLDDPRGNLALVALGIVARLRPAWFVFENVPGLLSSDSGRDFGLFLRAVDDLGAALCWSVLDAQYRGVAQRRERVFAVGHLGGDWRRAAAVLLEPESLCGHPPTRGEAREDVAGALSSRASGGGGGPAGGTDEACSGYLQPVIEVAPTLDARAGRSGATAFHTSGGLVAGTCVSVATSHANGGVMPAAAFNARLDTDGSTQAVTVALRGREGGSTAEVGGPVATALRASQGGADKPHVLTAGVRRLMPLECERLQGFPDHFTAITYRGKPAADGPRYKALGNSMAVPVVRWILERIEAVNQMQERVA